MAAFKEHEGQWCKTTDARALVSGNNTTKGKVLKELAESAAWPIRSEPTGKGGTKYTYEEDVQAPLVREVLGDAA